MRHFAAAEGISSCVSQKCFERFGLFLLRFTAPTSNRKWLPSTIADDAANTAILSIGEQTCRLFTIGRIPSFSTLRGTCGGNKSPGSDDITACARFADQR